MSEINELCSDIPSEDESKEEEERSLPKMKEGRGRFEKKGELSD